MSSGSSRSGGRRGGGIFAIGTEKTPDEALEVSNAGKFETSGEHRNNCQRCVWAYEMNRRGYNVEALGRGEADGLGLDNKWLSIAKGAKLEWISDGPFAKNTNAKNAKNVTDKMKSWGEGSRGIIAIRRRNGQGHVFNVEYRGGKVTAYDSQNRTKSGNLSKFLSENGANTTFAQIVRTDNLELNKSEFGTYVKGR